MTASGSVSGLVDKMQPVARQVLFSRKKGYLPIPYFFNHAVGAARIVLDREKEASFLELREAVGINRYCGNSDNFEAANDGKPSDIYDQSFTIILHYKGLFHKCFSIKCI